MPRIGVDCDITLTHASVNNGNPYGFLLKAEASGKRGSVTIQRQTYEDDAGYSDRIKLWATLSFADQATNPNGSKNRATRKQQYDMYQLFIAQRSAITLESAAGAIAALVTTQVKSTEYVRGDTVEAVLSLNNGEAVQTAPDVDHNEEPPFHLWEELTSILKTAMDGVTYYNLGHWTGADETLPTIGNRLGTKTGATIYCYDTATSAWKSVVYVGAVWIGDTTYTVKSGYLVNLVVGTTQHVTAPWIPVNEYLETSPIAGTTFIQNTGGTFYAGATGTFTDKADKVVTVKGGIITDIV